ncbi:MAG: hypothetical protein HRT36_01585 [Alphaproteobacteria bacterium]|nr:hypothetical protein [Alphaproteobacteria bacterium]
MSNWQLARVKSVERVDYHTLETQGLDRVRTVEIEMCKPKPEPEKIRKHMETVEHLNRGPQPKHYRRRPISTGHRQTKNCESKLAKSLLVLHQRVALFLKNSELVKGIERVLERRTQEEHVKRVPT